MSQTALKASNTDKDESWFYDLLNIKSQPQNDEALAINNQNFIFKDSILRAQELLSDTQKQTEETFGFKWKKRETFESDASLKRMTEWLNERYTPVEALPLNPNSVVLDAGCGAGMSGYCYFKPVLQDIQYVGADISEAIDVAKDRAKDLEGQQAFIQSDLNTLPFEGESFDIIFSEGVLHHTDNTEKAFKSLAPFLKPGGLYMIYVYRKKGPVREYTDDYIREKLQDLPPQEAWDKMMPLTKLGQTLGELDIEIDIEEGIDLLDIPAGKINLQRFFYWHVMKMFYRDDLNLDEMNHINFDWYTPANAHRHTLEEVQKWYNDCGLKIIHQNEQEAGITIIGQKAS
ncbi:MAG: class I SAM-dependent methyltransferase [Pseudomonadota bacterium]